MKTTESKWSEKLQRKIWFSVPFSVPIYYQEGQKNLNATKNGGVVFLLNLQVTKEETQEATKKPLGDLQQHHGFS